MDTIQKTKMQPIGDRVVAQVEGDKEKSDGGIYLPDVAQKKSQIATVLAVGPGKRLDNGELSPMTVKVGDRILVGKYAGAEVREAGDITVFHEDEILAIIE